MSEPIDATDGHRCGDDCTDGEPVVVGRWLRFLTVDHDGLVWVPIANITRIESGDTYLDVVHVTPEADASEGAPHYLTQAWDRITTPRPWAIASDIARSTA